jgi:hypothetical protein
MFHPTAMQEVVELQETATSALVLWLAEGAGMTLHALPFHCSASGT